MIRKIKEDEINEVSKVLANCFKNYEQVQILFNQIKAKELALQKYVEYQLKCLIKKGDVFVLDNLKAGYFGFDSKQTSLASIGFSMLRYLSSFKKILSKEDIALFKNNYKRTKGTNNMLWHRKYLKGRYFYLMMIGVDSTLKGTGAFRELLVPLIERCNQDNIPIILNTHRDINVKIYEHFGFKLMQSTISKDKSLKCYCMIHFPVST